MSKLGIDLGTTNTVACLDGNILELDEESHATLPSVVAFLPNGSTQTGRTASRRRSLDPQNTVFSSKRIIGRRFTDSRTRDFRERYPFDIVNVGGDTPAFKTRAGTHTPTEIAGILLSRVFEKAGARADVEVVITVPSGFYAAQREATRQAAHAAGFERVHLIDEPLATAWAYRENCAIHGCVAVYDLGGGTFDVSVLDCDPAQPRLLGKASDMVLGGDDVDARIADWAAREVLKQHNWDLRNYDEVAARLLVESERAKIRLSTAAETRIDLARVDPECPLALEGLPISRRLMDELAGELVRRTFVSCDEMLRDAGLRPSDLSAVLLAGGATHLPAVREGAEIYFGRAPACDLEPMEVVALGAWANRG